VATNFIFSVLRNDDVVALSRGMVIRVSDDRAVVRAQADTDDNLVGLYGIVGSGIAGVGGNAVVAISHAASEPILLEDGLTPVAGEPLYVSASVAGRATNVAPGIIAPIGVITDVWDYDRNSVVKAMIGVALA